MGGRLQKLLDNTNHPVYRIPSPNTATGEWWAKVKAFLEAEVRSAYADGYAVGAAEKGKRIHEALERFIKENGLENDDG